MASPAQMKVPTALRAAGEAAGLGVECSSLVATRSDSIDTVVLLTCLAGVLAPFLLFFVWRSRRGQHWKLDWADWKPRMGRSQALGWGAATGILAFLGVALLELLAEWFGLPPDTGQTLFTGRTRAELLLFLPLAVFAAPITEEYLFRAWTLERFARIMPAGLALALTAAGFAAMHAPESLSVALVYLFGGLVLGLLWLRSRSWLACIVAHGAYNLLVTMIAISGAAP